MGPRMNILGNNTLDKSSTSYCRRTMLRAKLKTIAYKELGIFLKDDVLKNLTKSRCQSYWVIIITSFPLLGIGTKTQS